MATAKIVIPKKPAQAADLWFSTRAERLALEKQVEELKRKESALKEHLINTLPKSDARGITGSLVAVTIVNKTRPEVQDADAFHAWFLKEVKKDSGAWAFLPKSVNATAVKERWENGKKIPGIEPFNYPDISYSAVKG